VPSDLSRGGGGLRRGGAQTTPYLQLDVPNHYPVDVKRDLARRLGAKYARIMQTTPGLVTVAFRELGDGGVWCCSAGEPEPAALLSCDIRRGRSCEQRAEPAQALIDVCAVTLGLRSDRLAVEFTTRATRCMDVAGAPNGRRPRQRDPEKSSKMCPKSPKACSGPRHYGHRGAMITGATALRLPLEVFPPRAATSIRGNQQEE
jgi:hypothetical protein